MQVRDWAALAADLDILLAEAGFDRSIVMGYSHGGAIAQQLAHTRPAMVEKLVLACTYACNVATLRERLEANVLVALLQVVSPGTIAKLILRPSRSKPTWATGSVGRPASGTGRCRPRTGWNATCR